MNDVVVEAQGLQRVYAVRRGLFHAPAHLQAVGNISFRLEKGRTLAVVGESGCGKSTLARMVALIEKPTAGSLTLVGTDAVNPPPSRKRELRQAVQLVFQNPYGSLNPRKKISAVLEDPLAINTTLGRAERAAKAREMLARVGLRPEYANRYPHMFSGGQRQRRRSKQRGRAKTTREFGSWGHGFDSFRFVAARTRAGNDRRGPPPRHPGIFRHGGRPPRARRAAAAAAAPNGNAPWRARIAY